MIQVLRRLIQILFNDREEDLLRNSKRTNLRKLLVGKIKEGMEKEREG